MREALKEKSIAKRKSESSQKKLGSFFWENLQRKLKKIYNIFWSDHLGKFFLKKETCLSSNFSGNIFFFRKNFFKIFFFFSSEISQEKLFQLFFHFDLKTLFCFFCFWRIKTFKISRF